MASQAGGGTFVSAATFVVNSTGLGGALGFSELQGINSKVASTEWLECGAKNGEVLHSRQFGKTDPPTVTLKRGLESDGNARLLAWHVQVRNGIDTARTTATLEIYDAAGKLQIGYQLLDCWPSELTISGVKAGDSGVATIEVKLTCAEILAA